jgi:hypothetical protein
MIIDDMRAAVVARLNDEQYFTQSSIVTHDEGQPGVRNEFNQALVNLGIVGIVSEPAVIREDPMTCRVELSVVFAENIEKNATGKSAKQCVYKAWAVLDGWVYDVFAGLRMDAFGQDDSSESEVAFGMRMSTRVAYQIVEQTLADEVPRDIVTEDGEKLFGSPDAP